MNIQYWNEELECLPRKDLEARQLTALKKIVDQSLKTPYYKKSLNDAKIYSGDDIKTLDDLRRIPFTTKHDLRSAFPYGMLAVPKSDIVRLHASSGTTGIPTTIYLTKKDIAVWTSYVARCIYATGCTKDDTFQNMITYGMFTGGLGFHTARKKSA
jgi:phenylacetate-CoA ligase